ncbi:hypothetical protein K474DRAFT_1656744 [Panus rudis PR-1116 ss-1]|nr:hypothetical protein K474DRAFT_1656744 [Panus rudis PR-1116 ss-1]
MAHVWRHHEAAVQTIHEAAESANRRKRKRVTVPDAGQEQGPVAELRTKLDAIQLKSWPLAQDAALFIRPPKHADHNTLRSTKQFSMSPDETDSRQAAIFVTVYSPLSWGHRLLARTSQHVLLSSQTLGDLFDIVPCISHELPKHDGTTSGTDYPPEGSSGAAIWLEGTLYGDGQSTPDYADKLQGIVERLPEEKRPHVNKGALMHDARFDSLSIRLHSPYWILHAGDCEHFFVIDQIRLLHSSDPPPSKFPLTTQITPPLLDNCRICNKVPAVYAVIGDVRLGESPFVVCAPCWRWMGMPQGEEAAEITVVPLPKYEFGWVP